MPIQNPEQSPTIEPLPSYTSILIAVDSSDHSNRGVLEAVSLAAAYGSRVTATHVYAARLHDLRFRQMEGGLPEQFRQEQELERQRDVHDDLITRGLSIITDSYLDQVDGVAEKQDIQVARRSLEGKNYRQLVNEANSGDYDLLVMGAQGLGAVSPGRLGTVCQRTARRSRIDTLIIKEPTRGIGDDPILVAVDGSPKSYGGLLTALSLAGIRNLEVKVISAFDPYYHYVAFNRIAGVLSEEAGQVFKFREQEKLHEEIIDSGLAKIYQGHLSVAASIARDYGIEVETLLVDGKPHDVIARRLKEINPSLLILGTTGIHADAELDIGGNAEHLLNDAPCAVLLSQREYQPRTDRLAAVTTSWTEEAEKRMERVPSFVRPMAKMAILRYAQDAGHTIITESIVEEATAQLMPNHAEQAMREIVEAHDKGELKRPSEEPLRWSEDAKQLLLTIEDLSLRGNLSLRAEKRARVDGASMVELEHLEEGQNKGRGPRAEGQNEGQGSRAEGRGNPREDGDHHPLTSALGTGPSALHWHAAALARLMRVPEGFMRDSSRERIEAYARNQNHSEVTLAVAEAGLAEARGAMEEAMKGRGPRAEGRGNPREDGDRHPLPSALGPGPSALLLHWTPTATELLKKVPTGFCRDMTRKAAETIAEKNKLEEIDEGFLQQVMDTFKSGSEAQDESMPWEDTARERIARAPDMVRGMLIREIEGWSRRENLRTVTEDAVDAVKRIWAGRGVFHLDPDDARNN